MVVWTQWKYFYIACFFIILSMIYLIGLSYMWLHCMFWLTSPVTFIVMFTLPVISIVLFTLPVIYIVFIIHEFCNIIYIIPVMLLSYLWILQYYLYHTCDFHRYIYDLVGHSKSVEVVVFSPDGQYLASGSWDRTAILWDREVSHKGRVRDIHNCTMFWNLNLFLSEFKLISIFNCP